MSEKTKLGMCGSCGGFLPAGVARCVHCAAPPRSRLMHVGLALGGTLGSGAMAFTLMACYGGACAADENCDYGSARDASTDVIREAAQPSVGTDAGADGANDDGGSDAGDAGDAQASDGG